MKFTIEVPATTANLGPGFDTAGIALSLYNTFTFDFTTTNGIEFEDPDYTFDTSLTLDTFFKVLKLYNIPAPQHIHLLTRSHIPVARGLGSSSTCIVAGIMAANQYGKLNLSKKEIAHLASESEGHPDNVTPAIFGNLCLSVYDKDTFISEVFKVHPTLSFIVLYPESSISTKEARSILPSTYSLQDITYSLSRVSLLAHAFNTGNANLLTEIIKDRLHEPYRKTLIQAYPILEKIFESPKIIASWISGSGPTCCALTHVEKTTSVLEDIRRDLSLPYHVFNISVDTEGVRLNIEV